MIGYSRDPAVWSLLRAAYSVSLPNRIILTLAPGGSLPAGHPAAGKGLVDEKAAAYVCEGPVCSLPVTTPESLLETLARVR